MKYSKETKSDSAESKILIYISEVIEEPADQGTGDSAGFQEILDVQTEELSEDQLVNIREQNSCDEKD